MPGVLVISDNESNIRGVSKALGDKGIACSSVATGELALARIEEDLPDLVLAETDNLRLAELGQKARSSHLPVIALVDPANLPGLDTSMVSDFLVKPLRPDELVVRVKRLLRVNDTEVITCGDLVIDLAKCQVTLEARPIMLAFKEYELLKFLASHRGRVYSRNALLDKVWGYDYYGGDRTVDVHVRRLRSKIEDPRHSFIDTVRNIGYRFRDDSATCGAP